MGRLETSLGIWALGPMVTRFVPGGYRPERPNETTTQRVDRAVRGLGELIDGYKLHYVHMLRGQLGPGSERSGSAAQTDVRGKPARPDDGTESGASVGGE